MTRNSGIGSGSLRRLPPVVPVGFALDPVGEETSTPTICTRRPTHAVMSVPLKRYPSMLDGELPAGAVPCTFAAVPASGAGAAGGNAGSGGGCAMSGDGATAPAGSTSAFISVIGCDFDPPVTHPVSVVVWGAGTGGWTSTVAAESTAVPFLALSLFTFQNNFWVNLHQLLHAEAVRQRTNIAATVTTTDWTPAERDAWRSALDAYAPASTRDVVFDRQLVALNDALSAVAGDGAPLPAGLPEPSLVDALNRAAAAYRVRVWPRHQQTNAAWISAMAPQVERHERALTQALAAAYRTPWPTLPIRVDVSIAAGRVGAYTTDSGPPGYAAHSTISPIGEGSDGAMGFEIIFHEASHAIDAHIMEMVRDECARQQVRVPGNLWHAIIFYTVGELVRRELGMIGDAHYMPYAYRFGVYDRGMSKERPALEQHWQPYLDGKIPFDEALRGLVRDATR